MDALFIHISNALEKIRNGEDTLVEPEEAEDLMKSLGLFELTSVPIWRAVFTEFIASTLFLFLVCLAWTNMGAVDVLGMSLASGLALMAVVQISCHVSGGYVNPAVTIARAVAREITAVRATLFVGVQIIGGILGTVVVWNIADPKIRKGLATFPVDPEYSSLKGLLVELVLTFVLTAVIFAVSDPNRLQFGSNSLVVGLTYTMGNLCGSSYTGASMNPIRSLSPALVSNTWHNQWIYWFGPVCGAVVAAYIYKNFVSPYFAVDSFQRHLSMIYGMQAQQMQRDNAMMSKPSTKTTERSTRSTIN